MSFRAVRIPAAAFRAMWCDATVSSAAIMARFDCSYSSLQHMARRLQLSPRARSRKTKIDKAECRLMWLAGVSSYDIARAFGCHQTTVIHAARQMGLPRRGPRNRGGMSLSEFRELRLRLVMRRSAAAEMAALRGAAMWDCTDSRDSRRRHSAVIWQDDLFRAMWWAGVSARRIGEYFGGSQSSANRRAEKIGETPRGRGWRPLTTLAAFLAAFLAGQDRAVSP